MNDSELFFIEFAGSINHPGCSHCHFNPLFTDNQFRNNGLDYVASLLDFKDPGRRNATQNINDSGRFRVPTLRNIAFTAPYMHDGRFKTLEEVLQQYEKGGHGVINEDPNILPFKLSDRDKKDLIAFLNMLSDPSFINNKDFSNPF
jgi:cytochrome c peroxidase